jgi:ribonucleotide reductase beta subunit family protein with ferritin-like domain
MRVTVPASTRQISYADLYARWERGHWRATELDFAQDRHDWHERMTPQQRRGALWLYALFFHGEDAVADQLSPYIDAAPLEEQKYFLATQQVDEAATPSSSPASCTRSWASATGRRAARWLPPPPS